MAEHASAPAGAIVAENNGPASNGDRLAGFEARQTRTAVMRQPPDEVFEHLMCTNIQLMDKDLTEPRNHARDRALVGHDFRAAKFRRSRPALFIRPVTAAHVGSHLLEGKGRAS